MPRNSGVYSAPPGTTVAANTTIESAKFNAFVADLVADANNPRPVTAGGTGAATEDAALTALGGTAVGKDVFRAASKSAARAAIGAELPAGAVSFFAMSTAPSGWLKANGTAVSRTTYADLFAAIGTFYGPGDGSTTFNLPDLRGEFLRGYDDGRGVDAGRTFGSAQAAAMLDHTHSGTTSSYTHTHTGGVTSVGIFSQVGSAAGNLHPVISQTGSDTHSHTITTGNPSAGGGTETRPRNVAVLACIKY